MTFKEAYKRITATAIQAAAATVVVLLGAVVAGTVTSTFVTATVITGFALPVATAVQRLFQAYNESNK